MRDLLILFVHFLTTVIRLARPGGARSVVAEPVLAKHQLLILKCSRERAPNLRPADRIVAGWCALFIRPSRLVRSAIVMKPSTPLHFHQILTKRKYRLLFSSKSQRTRGPQGPSNELVDAIVATKQRNSFLGLPANRSADCSGIAIDKGIVRRVLATHYLKPKASGPSWLTFLATQKIASGAQQARR